MGDWDLGSGRNGQDDAVRFHEPRLEILFLLQQRVLPKELLPGRADAAAAGPPFPDLVESHQRDLEQATGGLLYLERHVPFDSIVRRLSWS